ncbi:MAG: hypothetical protein GXO26_04320 [Crenarchaeota archaeon]|nr:hypothetical protein [Thermoproteota archaeon]
MYKTVRRDRLRTALEETTQLALEEQPPSIIAQHVRERLLPILHETVLVHGAEGTVDEIVNELGDETIIHAPHILAAAYMLGGRELLHRMAQRLIEHFPEHAEYITHIANTITHLDRELRE